MKKLSAVGVLVAIAIGLLFSCLIWYCQPYNDQLMTNSSLIGGYLPIMGVALVAILAAGINPLLRRFVPAFSLSVRQMAIIFMMVLVAGSSAVAIQHWPHSLAHSNISVSKDKALSEIHAEMDLPDALYIDTKEYGAKTPNSTKLNEMLDEGETIPWRAWIKPGVAWGSMLAFSILLMIGLALIVYPQWRENERLPFPLLAVQHALIEKEDDEKGCFPTIFRNKLFWTGAIIVLIIYGFKGLSYHTKDAFPTFPIPTGWALWSLFEGGDTTRYMNWWLMANNLSFVIIGVTYFMPNRVAFSIWFSVFAYQVYRIIGFKYFAPFHGNAAVHDHRSGAIIGVALVILWLGRRQWLAVAKAMFTRAKDDTDRRNRTAGLLFLAGCMGFFAWQMWAGNSIVYALLALIMIILTTLVVARMVAETGLPHMGNTLLASYVIGLLPIGWLTAKSIYLTNAIDLLIGPTGSNVSASVNAMHGFGVDAESGPKTHARVAKGLFLLAVLGMVAVGAVNLRVGYNYQGPMSTSNTAGAIGEEKEIEKAMDTPVKNFARKSWGKSKGYNKLGHAIFGLVVAVALQIACLVSPLWPLHPAGLVIMDCDFIRFAWPSIMLGWAVKKLIVAYGGARVYRLAKPIFLGMILGQVFSAIIWAAVPAILVALGGDAAEIGRLGIR